MANPSTNISAVLDAGKPLDIITNLNVASGGMLMNFGYFGIIGLITAGICYFNGLENGLLIGGLFGAALGLGFFALGWISTPMFFVPAFLLIVGIFLKVASLMR